MKTLGTLCVGCIIGYVGTIMMEMYLNEEGFIKYFKETIDKNV